MTNSPHPYYDMQIANKEKDMLISQLKAHIFELEQYEKDYDLLSQRFHQLQNDYNILKDAKMHLEYDLKQREDAYNQRLNNLRGENENLQLGYNEKMTMNKKLFSENYVLRKQIDIKNGEISDLNTKINNLSDQLGRCLNDKNDMEKKVQNLNGIKANQNAEISTLFEDNKKLSHICQEQERSLKLGEQEIKSHGNSINVAQKELDENNNVNMNLKGTIQDYERKCNELRAENDALKRNLTNENNIRQDLENKNANLASLVNDRDRVLANLQREKKKKKISNENVTEENSKFRSENDKLKNHARVLCSQNQKLIDELVNVLDQDEQIKNGLARKDQTALLLRNNENVISQSLNVLEGLVNPVSPKRSPYY